MPYPIPSDLRAVAVFAGGVGLGAYQAGAYAAVHEHGLRPDWIAGSSIGGVNAAVVAGNAPAQRVEKLQALWSTGEPLLQAPATRGAADSALPWRHVQNWTSVLQARFVGVQGHFRPRYLSKPFGPYTSIYDLTPLAQRIAKLVDFERLNSGELRLSLAATDIESGELVVFDTARGDRIELDHLLASCGYLPEFAPVEIGGRLLGDGGLVANAPIEAVMFDDRYEGERVCFVVDLFPRDGPRPTGLEAALTRKNDLMFANQTRMRLEGWQRELALAAALDESRQPAGSRRTRVRAILHLSYRAPPEEAGPEKMFDLSNATMNDRLRAGTLDMQEALREFAALDLDAEACRLLAIRRDA